MLSQRFVVGLVLTCALVAPPLLGAAEQNLVALADKLARGAKEHLTNKLGEQQMADVAVFAISDSDGNVTAKIAGPSKTLQGELIFHLQKQLPTDMNVLTTALLKRRFRDATSVVDAAMLDASNPQQAGQALQRLGLDVGLFGSFDAKGHEDLGDDSVRVFMTLVYRDGTSKQLPDRVEPIDKVKTPPPGGEGTIDQGTPVIPPIATHTSGRFGVHILSGIDDFMTPLPYITSEDGSSEYHKVFFLVLPSEITHAITDNDASNDTKGEYKIRIVNGGKPLVPVDMTWETTLENPDPAKEQQRRFKAAVMVDGVNSIYEQTGGEWRPVQRAPENCSQWVLTGPGWRQKTDGTLERVTGKGHSSIDIPGFQRSGEEALAFQFARAPESIAVEAFDAGDLTDIGLIEVHFYAEQLEGDQMRLGGPPPKGGTKPGRPVENGVFATSVKTYPHACEVWRIFYRFDDECPVPENDRIPVAFAE